MSSVVLNRICFVLAMIGMCIAGYLSYAKLAHISIPCGEHGGCDIVNNDSRAFWFGLPVAYFGFLGYVAIGGLAALRAIKGDRERLPRLLGLAFTTVGFLATGWLVYVSLKLIHQTCIWCLGSATTMTLLFITHVLLYRTPLNESTEKPDELLFLSSATVLALGMLSFGAYGLTKVGKAIGTDLVPGWTTENYVTRNIMGSIDAPVTIIEYADLTCPHCQRSFASMKQLVADSNGKIRLCLRHFPLVGMEGHELATPAAAIAEIAAEKNHFWQFVDGMYSMKEKDITKDAVYNVAKSVGVSADEIQRIGNPEDPAVKRVNDDIALANEVGIKETPTFIIGLPNRKPTIVGVNNYMDLINSPEYQAIIHGH